MCVDIVFAGCWRVSKSNRQTQTVKHKTPVHNIYKNVWSIQNQKCGIHIEIKTPQGFEHSNFIVADMYAFHCAAKTLSYFFLKIFKGYKKFVPLLSQK